MYEDTVSKADLLLQNKVLRDKVRAFENGEKYKRIKEQNSEGSGLANDQPAGEGTGRIAQGDGPCAGAVVWSLPGPHFRKRQEAEREGQGDRRS